MRKQKEKIILAYLKDYKIEYIVKKHYYCLCGGAAKPSKIILYQKYQYMIHLIITHCKFHQQGCFYMNSNLYKSIFYDHYEDMLRTLSIMGIIRWGNYKVGKHSTEILLLNWNIGYITSFNLKYIEWDKKLQKKVRLMDVREIAETPFIIQYKDTLSCLRLVHKNEALEKIDREIANKQTHKYHYYHSTIEDFNEDNLRIYNIDEQGRIYHALTSMPRSLREFFNIKYELDIGNSHPLLLNYFLVKKYDISTKVLKLLKKLPIYNEAFFNGLNIPSDVLEYIYKTQKGIFYDDFCAEFGDMERNEVKKKVFGQVFYSHLKIKDIYLSKFCEAFIRRFPNVYKTIRSMKIKTDDKLPHSMMRVESFLFRKILQECWHRGYKVVNLHDALIVFDVEENKNTQLSEFTAIIEQAYNRYGLFPTVKAEIGG